MASLLVHRWCNMFYVDPLTVGVIVHIRRYAAWLRYAAQSTWCTMSFSGLLSHEHEASIATPVACRRDVVGKHFMRTPVLLWFTAG